MNLTKLDELLEKDKFKESADLFKAELAARNLINPAIDKEWSMYADKISGFITIKKGIQETVLFWEDLYNFFINQIEKPLNIRVHKGHILFRWGLTLLITNFDLAKTKLKEALEEDFVLAKAQTSSPEEAQERLKQFSAYAMLCILESLKYIPLNTNTERTQFFEGILGTAYDFALAGFTKPTESVKSLLKAKIPQKEIANHSIQIYDELWAALTTSSSITIITLTGVILECILLSKLLSKNVTKLKNKDIFDAHLGELLAEAKRQNIVNDNNVRAIADLIHAFRNRIHPANELKKQDYPITIRVAATLKNLTDYAIYQWN